MEGTQTHDDVTDHTWWSICFCAKEGFILPTQLPLIEAINYGVGKTERVLYTWSNEQYSCLRYDVPLRSSRNLLSNLEGSGMCRLSSNFL